MAKDHPHAHLPHRPHGRGLLPGRARHLCQLSCEENLDPPPRVRSKQPQPPMRTKEIYEMFPNLERRKNSPGTRLSGGEQQMLAAGAHPHTGANLLLLD